MFIDRPALLLTGPMTDYCMAMERPRSEWIDLGPCFAPTFLVGNSRFITCHLFAIPATLPKARSEMPSIMASLNETYITAKFTGRTYQKPFIYVREKLEDIELPVLRRCTPREVQAVLRWEKSPIEGIDLFQYWLNSPHRRFVERVIVIPREEKP